MDKHVSELVQALADVRDRLGERAYREGLLLALHGVDVAIEMEGERRDRPSDRPEPALLRTAGRSSCCCAGEIRGGTVAMHELKNTDVIRRLRRLRRSLGSRAHADAVHGALHAIGKAALREAERRAAIIERPSRQGQDSMVGCGHGIRSSIRATTSDGDDSEA